MMRFAWQTSVQIFMEQIYKWKQIIKLNNLGPIFSCFRECFMLIEPHVLFEYRPKLIAELVNLDSSSQQAIFVEFRVCGISPRQFSNEAWLLFLNSGFRKSIYSKCSVKCLWRYIDLWSLFKYNCTWTLFVQFNQFNDELLSMKSIFPSRVRHSCHASRTEYYKWLYQC